MPKKILSQSPLEKRYNSIEPKPKFPIESYRMILSVGLKEGCYPKLWRDRTPNVQQFMRSLHPNCEICDVDQAKFSHDVHHLKWADKHDCTYENLFVICRGCHSRLHRRGWYPSQPWLSEWGDVPDGLISRGHLDKDGNPAPKYLNMQQNINHVDDNKSTDKSKTNAPSERKGKKARSIGKDPTVSTQK